MLQTRDRLGRMIPFVRKKEKLAFYKLLTFLPFFFSFFVLNGRMKQMLPFMEIGLATWKRR